MGSLAFDKYDFIVVGAGPAGSILASTLAKSEKRPQVLLVEAGGKNNIRSDRINAERWLHRMNPYLAWGYHTEPQRNLAGQVLPYDRGRGLGGSTAINFSCWTLAPRDDHDEIARLVDDNEWNWAHAKERYKKIESFHGSVKDVPAGYEKYLNPKDEDHGHDGPIKVGFATIWEPSLKEDMDIWLANGIAPNLDHNSGDSIGLAVCASSAYKGVRSTAADALTEPPPNLHILTDAQVARVIFDDKKAVGVTTLSGDNFFTRKEVILSSGSLDTPRILLYSGIGPADQLKKFGIAIVKVNNHVGQHLRDHHHINPSWSRKDQTTERHRFYKSKELQAAARTQWEADQTGPLSEIGCAIGIGFLKLENMFMTSEFQSLPEHVKRHLLEPTVPTYEFLLNGPNVDYFLDPENASPAVGIFVILLNLQSTGSAVLQSSDPKTPLLFDPNYFSHPYDKRLAVEATRDVLRVTKVPAFSEGVSRVISAPKSDSEEDILEYWRNNTGSTWHMTGSSRMGKDDESAVVDKDLKVFGVENLRVADMSVVPILPNCHTQTTAYWVGVTLADKLIAEYGLDD